MIEKTLLVREHPCECQDPRCCTAASVSFTASASGFTVYVHLAPLEWFYILYSTKRCSPVITSHRNTFRTFYCLFCVICCIILTENTITPSSQHSSVSITRNMSWCFSLKMRFNMSTPFVFYNSLTLPCMFLRVSGSTFCLYEHTSRWRPTGSPKGTNRRILLWSCTVNTPLYFPLSHSLSLLVSHFPWTL